MMYRLLSGQAADGQRQADAWLSRKQAPAPVEQLFHALVSAWATSVRDVAHRDFATRKPPST